MTQAAITYEGKTYPIIRDLSTDTPDHRAYIWRLVITDGTFEFQTPPDCADPWGTFLQHGIDWETHTPCEIKRTDLDGQYEAVFAERTLRFGDREKTFSRVSLPVVQLPGQTGIFRPHRGEEQLHARKPTTTTIDGTEFRVHSWRPDESNPKLKGCRLVLDDESLIVRPIDTDNYAGGSFPISMVKAQGFPKSKPLYDVTWQSGMKDRCNVFRNLPHDVNDKAAISDKTPLSKAEILRAVSEGASKAVDSKAPHLAADKAKAHIAWIRRVENCTDNEKKAAILRTEGKTHDEIAARLPHKNGNPMTRQGVAKMLKRFEQKTDNPGLFRTGSLRHNEQIDGNMRSNKRKPNKLDWDAPAPASRYTDSEGQEADSDGTEESDS